MIYYSFSTEKNYLASLVLRSKLSQTLEDQPNNQTSQFCSPSSRYPRAFPLKAVSIIDFRLVSIPWVPPITQLPFENINNGFTSLKEATYR
jgi:hypothetical protein